MAIPGKFETTRRIYCAHCKKTQSIIARSIEWSGDLRTDLVCTSPECGNVFEGKKDKRRATKGNVSKRPHVPLLSLPDGDEVVVEDYDCSENVSRQFCSLFNDVLNQIPVEARDALMAHWQTGHGSPHVWLLANRREWNGQGWAASRNKGLSLCVVSTLLGQIPDEYVKVAIAHELGHTLFVAGGEVNHKMAAQGVDALFNPPTPDPLRRYRPEWLVWQLMESWGFDQPAMEEWMERNLIDDPSGLRLRDQPLNEAEFEGNCVSARRHIEAELTDMVFPADFEKYLER